MGNCVHWFVWNPNGKVPSFEHPTERNAKIEAERLARMNPGEKFLVLKSVAECSKNDVNWVSHEDSQSVEDDLPF